jgi:hypothetical protein
MNHTYHIKRDIQRDKEGAGNERANIQTETVRRDGGASGDGGVGSPAVSE